MSRRCSQEKAAQAHSRKAKCLRIAIVFVIVSTIAHFIALYDILGKGTTDVVLLMFGSILEHIIFG